MVSASPRASSASHYRRAICDVAATLGFSAPTADETPLARALAARLMGHEVASLNTVRSILAIQPASTLVFREAGDISGLVATLLLKSCAEPDLVSGRFDGLAPDDEALGRADEPVSFYYVWGIAGATKTT